MKKIIIILFVLFFLPVLLFSANIRNLQISPQTVTPGENITVTFEYFIPDWGKGSYYAQISNECSLRPAGTSGQNIFVSEDGINVLATSVDGGRQGQQKSTGGWFPSSDIDSNIIMTVPTNYSSGTYYAVVAVKDWNIWANPNPSYDNYMCISFTVGVLSPTPTVTITQIPPTSTYTFTTTPTTTSTIIIPVLPTSTPHAILVIDFKSGGNETNIIKPFFRLKNIGNAAIDLNDVEVRFWYKYDGVVQNEDVTIYSSIKYSDPIDIGTYTDASIVIASQGTQDRYVNYTFSSDAGILDPGHYVEVQSGVQKLDNSNYIISNDWSFNDVTQYASWGRMPVYVNNSKVSGLAPLSSSSIDLRVNCGNGTYTDSLGNVWDNDQIYASGSYGYIASNTDVFNIADTVNGTNDPFLYQTIRYSIGDLSYLFDIPNGNYEVTFKFMYALNGNPGLSVFDLKLEESNVLTDFNLSDEAGYGDFPDFQVNAYDRTFNVTVNDGQLNIDFISKSLFIFVSAIEVKGDPFTPTPTPAPIPPCSADKDCAINWLHAQQWTELNGGVPTDFEYGSWPYDDVANRYAPNVGVTALAVLSFINEFNYQYFTDFPNNATSIITANCWGTSSDPYDPSIVLGIQYILRNVNAEGDISDISNPEGREITKTYDTSLALVALSAYRKILLTIPGARPPLPPTTMFQIETAMEGAYNYLLNAQCIPDTGGAFPDIKKNKVVDDNWTYDINSPILGGWGYPRLNWADMSNTQFALWALKTAEMATDPAINASAIRLYNPTTGVALTFHSVRKIYAGRFIKDSTYNPSTLGNDLLPTGIGNIASIYTKANFLTNPNITDTPNGGTYAPDGGYRTAWNGGMPYGSITAASLWGDFCVDALWDASPVFSSISSWNTIKWFETHYSSIGTPYEPAASPFTASTWYYYYVMSLVKALHMNSVPNNQFSSSGIPNWREDFRQKLEGNGGSGGYVNRMATPLFNYPCTYFWPKIPPSPSADYEERDIFDTICAVLSIETILQCQVAPYGGLRITLESPAQVYVVDEQGRRAGCINGMIVTEIPGSSVPNCESVNINGTVDGIYKIRVKGTANGRYHVNAESLLMGGTVQKERGVGDITVGEEQEWSMSLGRVYWPMTISTNFKKELLEVAYKPGDTSVATPNPKPNFRIYNNGTKNLDLSSVKVRYWYSYEGVGVAESASVIGSIMSTGQNLLSNTHAIVVEQSTTASADRYMEISFSTSGVYLKPGDYITVQSEFHKNDMSVYNQANDYSFRITSDYQFWDNVTGYVLGNLEWGVSPILVAPTATVTRTITPTFTVTPTRTEVTGTLTPYPIPTLEITVIARYTPMYTVYGPTPVAFPPTTQYGYPFFLTVRYYFPFDAIPGGPFTFYFHMDPAMSKYFYLSLDGASGSCSPQTDGESVTITCSALYPPYFLQFFFNSKNSTGLPPGIYHNEAFMAPELDVTPQLVNMPFDIIVFTQTVTPTLTATKTITETWTVSDTATDTPICSPTSTYTITETSTITDTWTASPTATPSFTASPTGTRTNTPTVTSTAILDIYESDNVYTQASVITSGMRQTHSIDPAGDSDWVKFDITTPSDVVLETSGPANDDTIIWLYNAAGVPTLPLIVDDDGGNGKFSKIIAILDQGTYYLLVKAYNANTLINTYFLDLTVNALATSTPTDTITETSSSTPTVTETVTITSTMTETPTQVPLPSANLRAQYFSYHTESTYNTIYVNLKIFNDGAESVTLSAVTAKYWYAFEGSGVEVVEIDDVRKLPSGQDIKSSTSAEIQTISQSGQDRVQITLFNSGAGVLATGEYAEVHLRVHKTDWSNYTQTNDYSFGTQTEFQDWQKLTLYFDAAKVWGLEPGEMGLLSVKSTPTPVVAEPLSSANTYNYPNPCNDRTSIRFSLEKPVDTNIAIYDLAGKLVWSKILKASEVRLGINTVIWELSNDFGADVANGVYILKISADGRLVTKKIAVVR